MEELCDSTLRVSNHSGKFDYYPRSGGRAVEDGKFVVFTCTRRKGHNEQHGWCQGFDAYWTFQWGEQDG